MRMDVIENISKQVIDICKKQNKPYVAIITTNGYNLTSTNIEKLVLLHVNHIAVTIDGTRKLHDSQRMKIDGSPTFDTIVQNLLYIRDYIKSQTLTVSIRSNITQSHISILDEYYNFFNEYFGKDSRFNLFIKPVADYGGDRIKTLDDTTFVKSMSMIYDKLSSIQDGIKFFYNFGELEVGGYTCTARHLHKYTIGCNGDVHKCDECLINPIGNINSSGLMELNEFEHTKWLLCKPKEQCDNCFFSGSCFMESCPKSRVLNNYDECVAKFKEIDSLILFASNTYTINML